MSPVGQKGVFRQNYRVTKGKGIRARHPQCGAVGHPHRDSLPKTPGSSEPWTWLEGQPGPDHGTKRTSRDSSASWGSCHRDAAT